MKNSESPEMDIIDTIRILELTASYQQEKNNGNSGFSSSSNASKFVESDILKNSKLESFIKDEFDEYSNLGQNSPYSYSYTNQT